MLYCYAPDEIKYFLTYLLTYQTCVDILKLRPDVNARVDILKSPFPNVALPGPYYNTKGFIPLRVGQSTTVSLTTAGIQSDTST